MNRKINLISHESQKIDGIENIEIGLVDNIFPYSCEILICKYFNIFEENDAKKALDILIDKIRPNGQIIIGAIEMDTICSDFINKQISNKDFFDYMKNIHNHFGIEDIIKYISNNENIYLLEINNQDYINYITLTKNK